MRSRSLIQLGGLARYWVVLRSRIVIRTRYFLGQVFRAATLAPSIVVTVFFGLTPAALYFLGTDVFLSFGKMSILYCACVLGVLAVLSIFIGGILALRTLPPERYAEVMISGRPVDEMFHVLSLHIIKACKSFVRSAERVSDLAVQFEDAARGQDVQIVIGELQDIWAGRASGQVESLIEDLKNASRKQQVVLDRIVAMKREAAKKLGMPIRRLCDHILQYGPGVHEKRVLKYRKNWEEMNYSMQRPFHSSEQGERFLGLIVQNKNILAEAKSRMLIQERLLERPYLFGYMQSLIKIHSISGSVQTYARLLEHSAKEILERLGAWNGDPSSAEYLQSNDDLRFIHRKQKAYPGYDLNRMTQFLCNRIKEINDQGAAGEGYNSNTVERQLGVLERLHNCGYQGSANRDFLRQSTASLDESVASQKKGACFLEIKQEVVDNLKSLTILPWYVDRYITESRARIVENFDRFYRFWASNVVGRGSKFIVTHGYSKTVREAIRRGLPDLDSTESPESAPRIFLLHSAGDDLMDVRMMKYEIKEGANRERFSHVASGDAQFLSSCLRDGDSVFVVIGVECFDRDGRFVHPRGLRSVFEVLRRVKQNKKITWFSAAVAEDYKLQRQPITRTEFFDDHFERIDLYGPEDIGGVISDYGDYEMRVVESFFASDGGLGGRRNLPSDASERIRHTFS